MVVVSAVVAATVAVPAVSGADAPAAVASPTAADTAVLNQWNLLAQAEVLLIRPSAHGQSRGIAMVQGAVYDAVNAIHRGYQPYLVDVEALDIDPQASYSAAIATAAHHVLVALVAADRVAALDAALGATLAPIAEGPRDAGVAAGGAAAAAMLEARTGDGYLATFDFGPHVGTGPGQWDPPVLDPDPWVGNLRPFLIRSPDQFRSRGPDPLRSGAYARDFNEVKLLGALGSTVRTADQTTAAIFWQFPPAVLWNRLVQDLSAAHDLDAVEEARLMAMVNLAAADGAISCWNDKYYWNFWRPVTAIRKADIDGNRRTAADPTWVPLFDASTPVIGAPLANPAFPDHPSGHGCLSGAVLNTMRDFFGTDRVSFDMHSGRFPGAPRHFDRFSEALDEIVDARVWGGIHFRNADEQGAAIGKRVARWTASHYFRPVH
jgi:hypothetical protein